MIFDGSLLLAGSVGVNSGAITGQAVAATTVSANTIDLGPAGLGGNQVTDFGEGEQLRASFTVLTAPTGGTSVAFQLIQADDAALTTNVEVLGATDAIPVASLPAGAQIVVTANSPRPRTPRRYLGARFVVVGAPTGMTIFGGVLKDTQSVRNVFKTGMGIA